MFKYVKILLVTVSSIAIYTAAIAEIYQWTDAAGVKHYSNTPPSEGIEVESSRKEIIYSVEESEEPPQKPVKSDSTDDSSDYLEELKQERAKRKATEAEKKTAEREALEAQKELEAQEIIEQTSNKKGSRRRQIRRQKKQERLLRELDEKYADKLKEFKE
jgi:hypothetical protein